MRYRRSRSVLCPLSCVLCLLACVSCALPPLPETGNYAADSAELLAKDPVLAWNLRMRSVPQDDNWHFHTQVAKVHDKATGTPGWSFGLTVSHAVPWPAPARATPTPQPPPLTERGQRTENTGQ